MNNQKMLSKGCHKVFLTSRNSVFMRIYSIFKITPTRNHKTSLN